MHHYVITTSITYNVPRNKDGHINNWRRRIHSRKKERKGRAKSISFQEKMTCNMTLFNF